jgi:hypothetical protein
MSLFIPPVEQLPADFWTDRAGQKIVAVIAHGTGGTDSRATLQHGDGRGVSIHRLITKAGKIYVMVDDKRGANHAGAPTSNFTLDGRIFVGGQVNRATLSFELENLQDGREAYPSFQLAAMGWQIADWRRQYGPLPILRHADLDPTRKRDPYKLSVQEMERWAAQYVSPVPPPSAPPPPVARYTLIAPCVPLTARSPSAPLAAGVVFAAGDVVQVGDIQGGWLWVSDRADTAPGIGFIPSSYAVRMA